MSVYKRIDKVIEGDDIYAEIAERLREELDYQREASAAPAIRGIMLRGPSREVSVPDAGGRI